MSPPTLLGMRKTFVVLALLVVYAANAFAWGQEGHRIVCRIAFDLLTPDEQRKVAALTKGYKTPPGTRIEIESYADACIFPDEARSNAVDAEKAHSKHSPWLKFSQFNKQHFINVARSTTTIDPAECHDDCVLTGIASQSKRLKDGANDQERAEALIFLGHFVGDIHQPLHVSYESDQGGNKVRPVTGGFYPIPKKRPDQKDEPQLNLHSVWDGSIIRKAITVPGWKKFADGLCKKITDEQKAAWAAAKPLEWAQESYKITTSKDVLYCKKDDNGCEEFGHGRVLKKPYQDEFIGVVDQRLQEAGARLAALIHEGLAP